jgi:hypothetical protein
MESQGVAGTGEKNAQADEEKIAPNAVHSKKTPKKRFLIERIKIKGWRFRYSYSRL